MPADKRYLAEYLHKVAEEPPPVASTATPVPEKIPPYSARTLGLTGAGGLAGYLAGRYLLELETPAALAGTTAVGGLGGLALDQTMRIPEVAHEGNKIYQSIKDKWEDSSLKAKLGFGVSAGEYGVGEVINRRMTNDPAFKGTPATPEIKARKATKTKPAVPHSPAAPAAPGWDIQAEPGKAGNPFRLTKSKTGRSIISLAMIYLLSLSGLNDKLVDKIGKELGEVPQPPK